MGIIGATLAIRFICRVNIDEENLKIKELEQESPDDKPHMMCLKVSNAYIAGRTLQEITEFLNRDIVCTRLMHKGVVSVPTRNTNLEMDDEILVVCAEADAPAIQAFIGPAIEANWREEEQKQRLISKQVVITRESINGKMLGNIFSNYMIG